jgi:hypothetical protein
MTKTRRKRTRLWNYAQFPGIGGGSVERPGLGHWNLELGIYLEFGACDLEF